jgi:hypothetical protein
MKHRQLKKSLDPTPHAGTMSTAMPVTLYIIDDFAVSGNDLTVEAIVLFA